MYRKNWYIRNMTRFEENGRRESLHFYGGERATTKGWFWGLIVFPNEMVTFWRHVANHTVFTEENWAQDEFHV